MKDFWDERYKQNDYAYGKNPNEYLKSKLEDFEPGVILFPAEGEGRNSVFAAKKGWKVSAFDISAEGKKKALRLAEEEGVEINYHTTPLSSLGYCKNQFDAIALIYAHLQPDERKDYFGFFTQILKNNGKIIFEGFSKKHLEYQAKYPNVGGPKEERMLFSEKEIKEAFADLDFLEFYEGEIDLNEGEFHKGKGWVIRFVAQKKS
ncbi:class I SAM-dependent methyltransferase [Gillisia sp. Q332]|uniref:class I SAM-dependent methyltransferase n=1 Tax=Gillisia xinjiangensis TaxID=3384765 RepID=UPI003919B963